MVQSEKTPKASDNQGLSKDHMLFDLDKGLPGLEVPKQDFWVFAYGSLIWNPGFDFSAKQKVSVPGYQRAFCLQSTRYRGTQAFPGLVLGLTQGSSACHGLAFRVPAAGAARVFAYLYEREMQHYAYIPSWLKAEAITPYNPAETKFKVLAFVMDKSKPTYRGELSFDERAAIIAKAKGPRGTNLAYLQDTIKALAEQGLNDPSLDRLLAKATTLHQQSAAANPY